MATAIPFKVDIDAQRLILRMRNGVKKMAYVGVNWSNQMARLVQIGEIEHVEGRLIIRKKQFFEGTPARPGGAAAKIFVRASVNQEIPYAEVGIDAESRARSGPVFLPIFQEGGERPRGLKSSVRSTAIPLTGRPARPSLRSPVPPQYTFQGLRFRAYQGKKRVRRHPDRRRTKRNELSPFGEFGSFARQNLLGAGKVQWKGEQRTFILTHSAKEPLGGVFQRIGTGREGIREIITFRTPKPLEKKLDYIDEAKRIVEREGQRLLEAQVRDALEHEGLPVTLLGGGR